MSVFLFLDDYCIYDVFICVNDDIIYAAAVRKEIQDETDRETGRTRQISSVPIHLSIYSPNGMFEFLFSSLSSVSLHMLSFHLNF